MSIEEADPKGSASVVYLWGEVQEDNKGKLNPSHSCGAGSPVHKATGGHAFPYVTLLNPYIVT